MKVRPWIQDRRGRVGLAAGAAVGLVIGLATAVVVPKLMKDDEGLEPGDLVIMSSIDESKDGQRQRLLDQWNDIHGDTNRASIKPVNRDPAKAHGEMLDAPSDVDILNLDVTWTAEFAASDRIRVLNDTDLTGFLEEPLRTCKYQGSLYALPFNTDAGLLYYRTFERAGKTWPEPPTSWDEVVSDSDEAFGARLEPKMEAGYAAQLDPDSEILTVTALEAIWAAGGDVVDDSGNVVIDSDAAERGLRRLSDGLEPGSRPVILPDSRTFDEKKSTNAFGDGRVLAMRNWPVAYRDLSTKSFSYAVTTVPGKTSVLGGQNLAVSRKSGQPRAAQALIEFLTGERSQQILFEHGGLAATREIVYRDENVTTNFPYAITLLEAIRRARPRPVTPHYTEFSTEFRKVVTEAWNHDGEITPEQATRLSNALQGKVGG
ncbi:extracellular solute-binding protein [Paractinoplanes toevensis]|uniref:ABC transporter substrate-binding protein n=1 Tax=Paractinoplanes toevensis TaxID=571911 RepID=A0A919W7R0_9ACTN|nr:extracellular solute-binding protein [Actinoplanes toevensis]GIM89916.1 ABC transporter substrate-binding protein [Actinoplanes toevensis]